MEENIVTCIVLHQACVAYTERAKDTQKTREFHKK